MISIRTRITLLLAVLALSCSGRQAPDPAPAAASVAPTSTATGAPPATATTGAPRATGAPPAPADAPLTARFADLPVDLPSALCREVMVAVVSGEASVSGDRLAAGDVLVTFHAMPMRLEGSGLVVIVDAPEPPESCIVKARPAQVRSVVRGQAAPPLVWANGAMEARLDVPASVSPRVYLGRLAGTAPVAEHAHDGSWEILCAVEAAGTFTLGGVEHRLGKREIVMVPAGTKHSWKPDAGSKLVGVQLYMPPGPEQRFKALAAAASSEPPPAPPSLRPPPPT